MSVRILTGDCRAVLATLPDDSVQCCVTSPPYYGLRDYGHAAQIGLEPTLDTYIGALVEVFCDVRRVLRPDGTLWLNLGDAYAGSWRGQGQNIPPSDKSTLAGNGHVGDGPKIRSRFALAAHQIAAAPRIETGAGSISRTSGLKPKDLMMIPARVAMALQADGWWLRKDIIWHKPNPMPESVTDRPTSAHEHVFLLTRSDRYYYDADAIREEEAVPDWDDGSRVFGGANKSATNPSRLTGRLASPRRRGLPPQHAKHPSSDQSGLEGVSRGEGRNARDVWTIATKPFAEAHHAVMPSGVAERCIRAGSRQGDIILDPFGGAGTTGLVADRLGRDTILIEINPAYAEMAQRRIHGDGPLLADVQKVSAAGAA